MPMDAQLAEIYGTGAPVDEDDLEKTASAELLVKIAEENGIDIDSLSDDELNQFVSAVSGGEQEAAPEPEEGSVKVAHAEDGGLYVWDENDNALEELEGEVKVAAAEDGSLWVVDDDGAAICPFEGEIDDGGAEQHEDPEFQEKVAEADFMGRVMAHAYSQEKDEIEKEAWSKAQQAKWMLQKGLSKVRGQKGGMGEKGTGLERVKQLLTGEKVKELKKLKVRTRKGHPLMKGRAEPGRKGKVFKPSGAGAKKRKAERLTAEKRKVLATRIGTGAGLTGATGLGAYQLAKESSALDLSDLQQERAYDILKEAGWVDEQGQPIEPQYEAQQEPEEDVVYLDELPEQEKTAVAEEVEVGALQILEEMGYPVEWNQ